VISVDYKELAKQFGLEVARVCVLAVIPVVLAYFEILSPEVAAVVTVALKGVDKAGYKSGSKVKLPF